MSILLPVSEQMSDTVGFTAFCGVKAAEVIERFTGLEIGIKWVNDLVLKGRKLGGIMTRGIVSPDTNRITHLVVGIGLNVRHKQEDFDSELRDMATSLELDLGEGVDLPALAACLIRELDRMWASFPEGKPAYLEEYRRDCITLGRDISLLRGEEITHGTALDIDDTGALIVGFDSGEVQAVNSGEVSVRGMYGYL